MHVHRALLVTTSYRLARSLLVCAFVACACLSSQLAEAQFIASRNEAQVNTYTTGFQFPPDIARLANGDYVVAYPAGLGDTKGHLLDSAAQPYPGDDIDISMGSIAELKASVAADPAGGFTVVWSRDNEDEDGDGDGAGVFGRSFDAAGTPLTSEFQVNTYTTLDQWYPRIETIAAGQYIVVWSTCPYASPPCFTSPFPSPGAGQDGSGGGVFAQRIDSAGAKIGTEFQVNTYTTNAQSLPTVAVGPAGNFLIAWRSVPQGIMARLYDSNAVPLTGEQQLDTAGGTQSGTRVAASSAGAFMVAWLREGTPSNGFGRLVNASGTPVGTEIAINDVAPISESVPTSVGATPDGGFVVAFQQDGEAYGRAFDSAAVPKAPQKLLNDVLAGGQIAPAIALDANGSFVAAWTSAQHIEAEIKARHFCNDEDLTCDRCPGYDDNIDDDADGLANGCDPCTNVAGARDMSSGARVTVRQVLFSDIPVKSNRVLIQGEFAIAGSFAGLDPIGEGAGVRVESKQGGQLLDVTLSAGAYGGAGTAGWQLNGAGTTWKFLDRTGNAPNGVKQMTIRDSSSEAPGLVKIKIKGAGGVYAVSPLYMPLEAIVALGDQGAADSGLCGESAFTLGSCSTSDRQTVCR